MLYVFFNGAASLSGPIANPKPAQLCLLAQVKVLTGAATCIGSAALEVDMIPGSSQGPPLYFDSAGGVYFGVADPAAGPLRVTVYRYYDGQTVQVTPDPGNQFLTTQIGQFVPFASGTAVVNTGGMSVFNGTTGQSIDTESGLWLMTPDSSGTTYTGDDLAPFNGVTYQALWQFPDGNAYATDLPVGGQTCLLGQISAATGQVNPDYCLDPDGQISNTDTALRMVIADLGDPNERLLSTANGEEWYTFSGLLAELYPAVQVFAVPPDTVPGNFDPPAGQVSYSTSGLVAGNTCSSTP